MDRLNTEVTHRSHWATRNARGKKQEESQDLGTPTRAGYLSHLGIYKQLTTAGGRRRLVKEPHKILTFYYSPRLLEKYGLGALLSSERTLQLILPIECDSLDPSMGLIY